MPISFGQPVEDLVDMDPFGAVTQIIFWQLALFSEINRNRFQTLRDALLFAVCRRHTANALLCVAHNKQL